MFKRKPFEELLKEVNNDLSFLTYYELLDTIEWGERRKTIIKRDNFLSADVGVA